MRSVLITGGAGFIGSNFVRHLLAAEPTTRIVNLDCLSYGGSLENLTNLPGTERHQFVQGDIADGTLVARLMREHAVDAIVHFAAETHVDRSIHGPMPFVMTNIVGTAALLEAARDVWRIKPGVPYHGVRFHHVSTDEVYGSLEPDDPAFSETTAYAPNSPYAASKAGSDHLVRAYAHTYGLPVTITNCSNNYGPRQYPEKLIPLMILNALQGQALPLYGDGQQVRDWLYVEDHCAAIVAVLRHGHPNETYNVGGRTNPTNREIVERLCAILDRLLPESPYRPHAALIRFVADRPGHDRRYAMDTRKIHQGLGWTPTETLESGLVKTVRWYLGNPGWIAAVRQRPGFEAWLTTNYTTRGDPA